MATCPQCGVLLSSMANFCSTCGTAVIPTRQQKAPAYSSSSSLTNPHQAVAHGFGNIFGLHPAIAVFTIAANLMMGTVGLAGTFLSWLTLGTSVGIALAVSTFVGCLVGVTTYLGQKKWYGDDAESARIKALIVGILTAIPVALPGVFFGGIALIRTLFHRRS